jgi:hypothetical protein
MVRSKAPKQFWDNCLKREAYVRSLTALGIYKLNGQVPETVVSGEIADFLLLVQFGFFTPCPIWIFHSLSNLDDTSRLCIATPRSRTRTKRWY